MRSASLQSCGRSHSSPRAAVYAFVENEIDDLEHRGEPLDEFLAARRFVGKPGFSERSLGAHDALGDRGLRHQKGARDLFGGQAANHRERQRCAGLS